MYSDQGDVPFIKVYNLTRDGVVDFSVRPTFIDRSTHERMLGRSCVRPGDVLTNIVGPPLGKTAVVPVSWPEWNINQAIVVFRAGSGIHPNWLTLALHSPFILNLLQKTARATADQFNISLSTCRELPLPVPPEDKQLRLVEILSDQLDSLDRLSTGLEVADQRIAALRRVLHTEAFAGHLVPQDVKDEPASVLLERIRFGQAAQSKPKRTRQTKNTTQETLM